MIFVFVALLISSEVMFEECGHTLGEPQSVMNECAEQLAMQAENIRKLEFEKLILDTEKAPHLPDRARAQMLEAFSEAEERWLAFRDAECFKVGMLGGGSAGIMQHSLCRRGMAVERAQLHRTTGAYYRIK